MNKKTLMRVSSSFVVLAMAIVMLLANVLPAYGETAGGIKQLYNVDTNYQQYLDSSVAFQLPETVKDDQEISVIIMMGKEAIVDAYEKSDKSMTLAEFALSEEAVAIRSQVNAEKNALTAKLDKNSIAYSVGLSYDTVITGFEILIKAGDFADTCALLEKGQTAMVGEVYNVAETKLVNNKVDYYEETGIFDSSDFAYDGSGMVVAVLDTGLDYTHSAFSVSNFTSDKLGLTKDQVAALVSRTEALKRYPGLTADDLYLNDKVPFAFDYADNDPDVYSLYSNHGTHVSGVIVGKDDTITGVAPNAQLVSMKIFSDTYASAYSSWILAALEDCVLLGVDVINMSLGTACGFSRETDEVIINGVYDRLRELGVSVVVAASNSYSSSYGSEKNGNLPLTSNPDTGTVGSPSTYPGSLSVASIKGVKTPYMLNGDQIIYFVEASTNAGKEKDFFADLLVDGKTAMDLEYVVIPGVGRPVDYTGLDMTNKIALVRRGSTTFEEKATAAQRAGAAAVIIYNNVAGDIKMNAGRTTIPLCSISQDDGEKLAAQGGGTLKIAADQKSGPFMSDFSSWGPTPSLEIKPEITAHGGNILSAVTGGTYDRLSGTSMASPNMAGVVALMRQYVIEAFPEIANDSVAISATVNRLLMSTADIIYNQTGLPYAVRKQGAGLANLTDASTTSAYIMTYDRVDGSLMEKSKIELGDDPAKSGVYTLNFSVNNFGTTALTYDISAYVMTEGVSDTLTHKGETTVTEEGYILDGANISITKANGGTLSGTQLTVPAGKVVDVTVQITLSDSDKEYLDKSFENGMYVEGFVVLDAVSGTEVSLNVPYLAFYGDWNHAPLFDLDYFETNKDELDDSIETLDKTLPDTYATRPVGGIENDYIGYLGSYYFIQNPSSKVISASRDYIALSNTVGTMHSIRFVWAGALRNAVKVDITITDSQTGELIFETTDYDVRKSYGDGGTIRPANVEVEFDSTEYNLKNNTVYNVKLVGYTAYGDGGLETNEKNVFEFPMTADFEAPAVTGCEFYTEYDRAANKLRLFAKIAVYDNHYSMAMQVGYVGGDATNGFTLNSFDSYLTPIYSNRNTTNHVVYELTDYIYEIKENAANKNTITVGVYDYALNNATYEIPLPDDFADFYFEDSEITLSPNEVYTLAPLSYPGTEWIDLIEYRSTNTNAVNVVNNKLIAVAPGVSTIIAKSPTSDLTVNLKVTVLGEGDEGYKKYDKPVADVFELTGFETIKAYYMLSSTDRDIGENGSLTMFGGRYSISMYPSETVKLIYELAAFFPKDTSVVFESSNDTIVSIDQAGKIVANEEGFSSVSVRVLLDGKNTYYSATVDIEVKDPYVTNGPWLTHYYGNGGTVIIPEDLMLTELSEFAFSNCQYILKEPHEITEESPDASKPWYVGDNTIKKVVIPEGVEKIGPYAFAGLTALEEVVLPKSLMSIEYGAFMNCTKLTKVTGIENVKLINKWAFQNCNLAGSISLDSACAISDYAFANNRYLTEIILPKTLQSIGAYAFSGDQRLESVTVKADTVKYGAYVFNGCKSLTEMTVNTAVIPEGAFNGCTALSSLTIGKDVSSIGELAFRNTAIATFTVADGNTVYKAQNDGAYLLSADGTTLVLVAPTVSGEFKLEDANVTAIGNGAFSANTKVTSVVTPYVTRVNAYALYNCNRIRSVTLGKLTYVGKYAFSGTTISTLPAFDDSLDTIGEYAFSHTNIPSVNIKDGMNIGEGAFYECKRLATVVIGDNVTIGEGAFMLDRATSLADVDKGDTIPYYTDNGKRIYYFDYKSALKSLTIGENVTIGDSAFFGASKITSITLGSGATIGDQAFYNCTELVNIDLSGVKSIGDQAFSGDVDVLYTDTSYSTAYVKDNNYVYHYFAPKIKTADLSALESLGKKAFEFCLELTTVTLGEKVTVISENAFAAAVSLTDINLDKIVKIENYGLAETAITSLNIPAVESIGDFALVYCRSLTDVTFGENITDIGEGAFAYCDVLDTINGFQYVKNLGDYSFAYNNVTEADLSGAITIGDHVFIKDIPYDENGKIVLNKDGSVPVGEFKVTLGASLVEIGDNPFAFSKVAPFFTEVVESFNGKDYTSISYNYDISDTVKVIDGSLYCKVPYGYELITYTGDKAATVAEDTVRVTAFAFAGSNVVRVELPSTLNSIGHKAFYGCVDLTTVIFKSYEAPVLEEEFDSGYYDSFMNFPQTGIYDFTLNEGTAEEEYYEFKGLEIVPYYMWNATAGMYSNVYYGANFVDYIGRNDKNLVMVRPSNGQNYETFIYGQYFSTVIDGALAADDVTLAAIEAILKIPSSVKLEHEAIVLLARAAYDKIATDEQRALIYDHFMTLSAAERKIAALKSAQTPEDDENDNNGGDDTAKPEKDYTVAVIIVTAILIVIGGGAVVVRYFLDKKQDKSADKPVRDDNSEKKDTENTNE